MLKNKITASLFILFSLALAPQLLQAQENSAYTRYGIGELKSKSFAELRGSGEISAAFNSATDYDINNPASLAFLKLTTFQFGGFANVLWVKTKSQQSDYSNSSMDYLSLGFPVIKNRWGAAIGLSPVSRANYNAVQKFDAPSPAGVTANSFSGGGSFNQFYFANGLRVKNFSVGLNVSYLFGTISYINTMEFADTANAYNTLKQESRTIGAVSMNGGVQYNLAIGKKYHLSFGVDGNLKTNLNTSRDVLFKRFVNENLSDGSVYQNIKDTVYTTNGEKGNIVLPLQLDGGVIIKKEDKFFGGVQFHYGKWSDYRSFGESDSTANNWRISAGGEWIPNSKSIDSYFDRVRYRLGAYYGTNYIRFAGSNFNQYGVTAGVGFPVRRSGSLLNITFDVGQSGNVKNNLIRQTYLRTTIGFSLSDVWFLKRKFD